MNNTMPYSVA